MSPKSDSLIFTGDIFIDFKACLLNVDLVKAFIALYGGGLPVNGGHEIAEIIKAVLFPIFSHRQRIATYDLHAKGQITLAKNYRGLKGYTFITQEMFDNSEIKLTKRAQFTLEDVRTLLIATGGRFMIWPDHGIIGTNQTELDPHFKVSDWLIYFAKGMNPTDDANSAVKSLRGVFTHLVELLRSLGFTRIFLTGLAYDVCVGLTAIHLAEAGFEVYVIKDCTRAVDINGSINAIEAEFVRTGVKVIEDVNQLRRAA